MRTAAKQTTRVIALLLLMALGAGSLRAQTVTYYKYNLWKGKNGVAYVTPVYSFDIPDYRSTAHYYDEIKGNFLRGLEIEGVKDWNSYYMIEVPDSKDKAELEDKRLDAIARLKRDGYAVKTLYFSWKPKA